MSFITIKGQDRQIGILVNALRNKTLAHAYLFTGIPGIGKTTTAFALAKALHCRDTHDDFCDRCISCRRIAQGTHPDLVVIEPEGDSIKINQIRKMQEQISYSSYGGSPKVVLIAGAERMNIQSSNCLLKTLEEPPPHTLLILLTSVPYRLPPTVRSRCQRVMFQPLPQALIEEALRETGRGEEVDHIELIASLAGGSLGRAVRWMEKGLLREREELLQTLSGLQGCAPSVLFNCAELLGEDREPLLEKFEVIRWWLRDLLILKLTSATQPLINKDLTGEASAAAARVSCSTLFENALVISEVETALYSNVNVRLAVETMLLRLCRRSSVQGNCPVVPPTP